jgi:hypothetical protein
MAATAVATVLLVACGNESGSGEEPSMTPTSGSNSPSPDPTSEPTTPPTLPADPVEQAKADLAARLRVDAAQVKVVSASQVTWNDGSLGCPQPGMFYTQALVDGFKTVLEVAGTQYSYHSGAGRAPFLCETPQQPSR